jgi:hypothetical protein
MHHFTISLQLLRQAYFLGYPICLFPTHLDAMASCYKMAGLLRVI